MAKKSTAINKAVRKSMPAVGANKSRSTSISTAVRNTAIPKAQPAAGRATGNTQITHDMIAKRAYEIWQSGQGGSEHENWIRAERELRGTR